MQMTCLERAKIWEELIPFCEEIEREEFEAEVGWPERDPGVILSSFSDPGGVASLKSPKIRHRKTGFYDPKTMSRAVARDLGLI